MGNGTSKYAFAKTTVTCVNRWPFYSALQSATGKQISATGRPGAEREAFTAAIDQGTTSSRFLIFDGTGAPCASHQMEFEQHYPHSG